jgi:hypothetical protein
MQQRKRIGLANCCCTTAATVNTLKCSAIQYISHLVWYLPPLNSSRVGNDRTAYWLVNLENSGPSARTNQTEGNAGASTFTISSSSALKWSPRKPSRKATKASLFSSAISFFVAAVAAVAAAGVSLFEDVAAVLLLPLLLGFEGLAGCCLAGFFSGSLSLHTRCCGLISRIL